MFSGCLLFIFIDIDKMIWQIHFPLLNNDLFELASSQSLTAALSDLGDFSVQLDYLGVENAPDWFHDFRLPENVFTRRVTLHLDNAAVVHAQSVCAVDSRWRDVLDCGTTPLGAILFSGSLNITRSPIEFAMPPDYVLARRSWFEWGGERLYLVECFLPQIANFSKKSSRASSKSV